MDDTDLEIASVLSEVSGGEPNPFVLLGVGHGALDSEALKAAYKRKSLLLHPDRNGARPGAAEAFKHVTGAYVRSSPAFRPGLICC